MAIFVLVWTSYHFGQWYCFEGGTGSRRRVIWYDNGRELELRVARAHSGKIGPNWSASVEIGQDWSCLPILDFPRNGESPEPIVPYPSRESGYGRLVP